MQLISFWQFCLSVFSVAAQYYSIQSILSFGGFLILRSNLFIDILSRHCQFCCFFLWVWENRELWVHSIIIIIYINAIFFKLLSYVALKFSFPHFLPRLILSLCHSFCLPYSLNLSRSFFSFSRQQRHISDSTVNNRRSKTLRNGELKDQRWSTIQVILELEERNLWQFWCIQSDLIEYRQFFVETAVERFMVSLSVIITFKASNQAKSQRGILNE